MAVDALLVSGGGWETVEVPSLFAVGRSGEGRVFLVDTGYAQPFKDEVGSFPYCVYDWIIPVTLDEGGDARAGVKECVGVEPEEVDVIFITHFHPDHVAGLSLFPNARYVYLEQAYACLEGLSSLSGLSHGFLPGLIPLDFASRSDPLSVDHMASSRLIDRLQTMYLEGDGGGEGHGVACELRGYRYPMGSNGAEPAVDEWGVWVVPLPGHTEGHMGVWIETEAQVVFMVGDAVWTSRGVEGGCCRLPHPAIRMITHDWKALAETTEQLHALQAYATQTSAPLFIVPAHEPMFLNHSHL